jgi:hypothetical protein
MILSFLICVYPEWFDDTDPHSEIGEGRKVLHYGLEV